MSEARTQIATSAASILQNANLAPIPCLLGFDGFVDSIIEVVDKRHNAESYDRVGTIAAMAKKIAAAAGQSANYEFVTTLQKLGGNGPIMASALAAAGLPITYLGALGLPDIHPVFHDLAAHATVCSLSDPGFTDALEFTDGKLMLGKHHALKQITYETLLAKLGKDKLIRLFSDARLIAINNWTMVPCLTALWKSLLADIMPALPKIPDRLLFIDLADPEKRTTEDLREALATLAKFQPFAQTILGLNLKESTQIAAALGISVPQDAEPHIAETASAIRQKLNISCVVIHPRRGAAAADSTSSVSFAGPFVAEPKISTGAGDHFNAGFCLAQLLHMTLPQSLATGTATSGYYVRHAQSPTQSQLITFLKNLPQP